MSAPGTGTEARTNGSQPPVTVTEAALAIAATGIPVFRCGADKKPLTERGFKNASTDPARIRRWFLNPKAKLIGIPTGERSGVDIMDLDPRHGSDAWREANIANLPETRIHQTGGGGEHWVFRHVDGVRNSTGKIAPGIDIRGEGGYAIWPGSPGCTVISDADVAPWPAWLLVQAQRTEKPKTERPAFTPQQRTDQLEKRHRSYINSLLDNVRAAPDGQKHDTLLRNARALGGFLQTAGISESDAHKWLIEALPASVEDWDSAKKTATDGLQHGMQEPFDLEDRPRPNGQYHAPQDDPGYRRSVDAEAAAGHGDPADDGNRDERSNPDYECCLAFLKQKEFKPIMWIVPQFIPEGLTVFAGKPKIGKSWLMLGTALGVARGTEALGQLVTKGDVLYLGLEDGERRMQSRVSKVLGPAIAEWPANFTFRWRLDALDAGGLDYIEKWLIEHPDRRLVVIDTLGKVRGAKRRDEEQYQYDYRMLGGLQELATRYRVAIAVVHHVRKSDAEDVLDTVSGTTGIAGAADSVMVLGITDKGARLYVRGRDCEEQDKLVEFDHETAIWEVVGDFDEANPGGGLQGLRKRVYDLLASAISPLTPAQITEKLNDPTAPRAKVKLTLWRMLNAEPPQVAKSGAGAFGAYEAVKPPRER